MKNDSIAARIKEAREAAGLTQAQLAKIVGTTSQNISQYERGLRKPKIEMMKKLADALECPVDTFTTDDLSEEIPSPELISKKIHDCRTAAGLTQQELAEKIGLDGATIGKYERGILRPKSETIKKIADVLGIGFLDLFTSSNHENFSIAQERHRKEVLRERALPAVISLLKAIYGKCDYTAVYELLDGCHAFETYYALNQQPGMERTALEPLDVANLTDIVVATLSAATDGIIKDELSIQERIESNLKSFHEPCENNAEVLEELERIYKKEKFDRAIPVDQLNYDPDEENTPAEKA